MIRSQLVDYIKRQEDICYRNDTIAPELYAEYGVKRGLRDENGNGVLTGLTNISRVTSSKIVNGEKIPCDGELWYRGYRIDRLIQSMQPTELGFEKVAYLLLMGEMPSDEEYLEFR